MTESTNAGQRVAIEEIGVNEARDILGDLLLRAQVGGARFILTRYGKAIAGLVGHDDVKRLALAPGTFVEVESTDARERIGELVIRASLQGQRYLIVRYGLPTAGLVDIDDIERLERLDGRPSTEGSDMVVGERT